MIIEVSIGDEIPRRYRVRRAGERIDIRQLDGDATVDNFAAGAHDDEISIDWRRPQPGIYSLLVGDASYEVFVEDEPDHVAVHLVTRTFRVHAADIRRHRASGAEAVLDGLIRLVAPIPGRVARVLVEPGQAVERGEGIIVLEAMKMENELRAPRDGVIGVVEVDEGQGVEGGALLATIE